jgi:glycerate 2-kinase
MAGLDHVALISFATDGEDGVTDSADAIFTGDTLDRGFKLGLNIREYLENNDSYHYFMELEDSIMPGLTSTNVNDLTFLLAFDS